MYVDSSSSTAGSMSSHEHGNPSPPQPRSSLAELPGASESEALHAITRTANRPIAMPGSAEKRCTGVIAGSSGAS